MASVYKIDGLKLEAYTLEGERAVAFEDAGVAAGLMGDHALLPNVHHTPTVSTKELFVPVFYASDPAQTGGRIDGAGDLAAMFMLIAQDFAVITDLELIFRPAVTGADMHFGIETYYCAKNGEAWNEHTESVVARDIGATVTGETKVHSIADLVDIAALAVGDVLNVWVKYDATVVASNAFVYGLRLKYT